MRIIHLLSQKELTGAEAYAVHLAEEQQKLGHQVHIFSDALHLETSIDFESWSIHKPGFFEHQKNVRKLKTLLKEKHIHILHAHSRAAVRLAAAARRGTGTALITTAHGRQHFSWSKRFRDIYGDRVIAICENVAEHLKADFRMNPRKIVVLRNPFSFAQIKDPAPEKPSFSAGKKISFVGRFSGPKGILVERFLHQVFPSLLKTFPDLHIDLVGRNSGLLGTQTLGQLEALQKHFSNRIQLVENSSPLKEYWPQAGELIIGAGRVAVEALLAGKKVFALGEASWVGLVDPAHLPRTLESNFGDIGFPEPAVDLDFNQISLELKQEVETAPYENPPWLKILAAEFDTRQLIPRIMRLYESAWFQKQKPKFLPILMYHKVVPEELPGLHRTFVTAKQFEKHLRFFQKQGFTTLTFKELAEFRNQTRPLSQFPKKPLILTFDDGYQNNLEYAVPLLRKYGMKAVFYLLADLELRTNRWDEEQMPLLNPEERRQLSLTDSEIGCHGFRHHRISEMSESESHDELLASRLALEKEFDRPIPSFAFTYGDSNALVATQAQKVGYEYALNTDRGGLHHEENPFQVFRINIFPQDDSFSLWKKTSPWYRRYYLWKRRH